MQLVAYGAQDIYLTGNPQITFFKVVYRRHTNFSMEAIAQTWSGDATSADGKATATISRNGDLIYRMYLELNGKASSGINNVSSQAITSVELEIGGQKIDKHTGDWMEIWAELTQPNSSIINGGRVNEAGTSGHGTLFQQTTGMGGAGTHTSALAAPYFVPLQFWFCRNVGLALPLIALQYHEVKVILDHKIGATTNFGHTGGTLKNTLWVDYIYLDTDERRRFAQVSHEYLIEQIQEESWSSTDKTLNFNHPVKELIWAKSPSANSGTTVILGDLTDTWQLKLNGHDRFAPRNTNYFTRVQVMEHHTGPGGIITANGDAKLFGQTNDGIAVYSFALKPEEHQPSGTCNFSRIDNAQLDSASAATGVKVYAINYNVLRIMSGMGGLAYSN